MSETMTNDAVTRLDAMRCHFCGSLWADKDRDANILVCSTCEDHNADEYGNVATGRCAYCGNEGFLICLSDMWRGRSINEFLGCLAGEWDETEHLAGQWACSSCFQKQMLGELSTPDPLIFEACPKHGK